MFSDANWELCLVRHLGLTFSTIALKVRRTKRLSDEGYSTERRNQHSLENEILSHRIFDDNSGYVIDDQYKPATLQHEPSIIFQ